MIGTQLIEELVQSVALSHRIKGQKRVSLLLLAAPESGKTTVVNAANVRHVCRVAIITGRSILREVKDNPHTEFLAFNDLTAVRAMSPSAVALLIVLLNQLTQDEHGLVAFAGKEVERIERSIGIIACLPFATFVDHRARWKELGFVSRMVPFAYSYSAELVAQIKDAIDTETIKQKNKPIQKMPQGIKAQTAITVSVPIVRRIRALADARALRLGQLGIRLLQNYHCLIRAHALLRGHTAVDATDMNFLRDIDAYVSITECRTLLDDPRQAIMDAPIVTFTKEKRQHGKTRTKTKAAHRGTAGTTRKARTQATRKRREL